VLAVQEVQQEEEVPTIKVEAEAVLQEDLPVAVDYLTIVLLLKY
jgi:hypothetical protein